MLVCLGELKFGNIREMKNVFFFFYYYVFVEKKPNDVASQIEEVEFQKHIVVDSVCLIAKGQLPHNGVSFTGSSRVDDSLDHYEFDNFAKKSEADICLKIWTFDGGDSQVSVPTCRGYGLVPNDANDEGWHHDRLCKRK